MTEEPDLTPESGGLEEWSYRLLLGAVFGITFSIALGEALLAGGFLLFVAYLVRSRKLPVVSPVAWIGLVFVTIAVLTAFFGVNRAKGIAHLDRLFWLVALPMTATLVSSRRRLEALVKAFVFGCGVLAVHICVRNPIAAVNVWLGGETGETFLWLLISEGSMTDGQMLMLGMLATSGMVLARSGQRERRALWTALLTLQTLALVINFKRGSWICAVVFILAFVARRADRKVLLLLLGLLLFTAVFPPVRVRLGGLARELSTRHGGRLSMWVKVAPALIKRHPWGVGYGSLTNRMMRRHDRHVERRRDHLHSNPLQVLVETGWAGLLVYFVWMTGAVAEGVKSLADARRNDPRDGILALALLLMFLALLANGLVEYNFGDSELLIVYAVLMGCFGGGSRWRRQEASRTSIERSPCPV